MTDGPLAGIEADAIIVAGGAGTRLGGIDKPALLIGGVTLLDRALDATRGARTVVVGPHRPALDRPGLLHAREEPPLSGPAAAIAAGLAELDRDGAPASWTLVIAADLPHVVPAVRLLVASALRSADADRTVDGWLAVDGDGRDQYLLALYRTDALARGCRSASAAGTLAGASVRRLLDSMTICRVALPPDLVRDVDYPADLEAARGAFTHGVPLAVMNPERSSHAASR